MDDALNTADDEVVPEAEVVAEIVTAAAVADAKIVTDTNGSTVWLDVALTEAENVATAEIENMVDATGDADDESVDADEIEKKDAVSDTVGVYDAVSDGAADVDTENVFTAE